MNKKMKAPFEVEELSNDKVKCKKIKELEEENQRLKSELETKTTELSIRKETVPPFEFAEIKSGDNFVKIAKSEDDIRWASSILEGMLRGYFGSKPKKWK